MVITTRGIVATAQTLASQAGAQILARGGSAVDAAIAANAVLSVVEPMMNGPGGDLFALVWDAKTGSLTGINASGWAPKGLSIDYLKKQGMLRMPTSWHPHCHRARLRGGLGKTSQAFRPASLARFVQARHLLCRERLSRDGADPVGLGKHQLALGLTRRASCICRTERRRRWARSSAIRSLATRFA